MIPINTLSYRDQILSGPDVFLLHYYEILCFDLFSHCALCHCALCQCELTIKDKRDICRLICSSCYSFLFYVISLAAQSFVYQSQLRELLYCCSTACSFPTYLPDGPVVTSSSSSAAAAERPPFEPESLFPEPEIDDGELDQGSEDECSTQTHPNVNCLEREKRKSSKTFLSLFVCLKTVSDFLNETFCACKK